MIQISRQMNQENPYFRNTLTAVAADTDDDYADPIAHTVIALYLIGNRQFGNSQCAHISAAIKVIDTSRQGQ